jgi:TRAP-type C4-dicarboxylate transport system substrate-binding protein
MYVALQTGVVDCAVYLSAIAKTVSLQEVTEYESFIYPLGSTPQMFGVSDKTWNSLTPEQRNILTDAGDFIWEKTKGVAVDREREASAREERKTLGITVLDRFPKDDREKIVQASRDTWADIVSKIDSEEAAQNREMIIKLIDAE